jgi:hypothetical protein
MKGGEKAQGIKESRSKYKTPHTRRLVLLCGERVAVNLSRYKTDEVLKNPNLFLSFERAEGER